MSALFAASRATNVAWDVAPVATEAGVKDTVTVATAGGTTVIAAEPVLPSLVAMTVVLPAVTPVTTVQKYTIATFTGGYANTGGVNEFNTVLVNGLATQDKNAGAANYALVTYNADNIELTVNNLAAIPEPTAVGLLGLGAVGLLGRRRRTVG